MPTNVVVCNGCCCGRVEKGHNEVPINALKTAWKKYGLENSIKLTISGCLGPCSMHNVTLLKTDKDQIWLGKLSKDDHYEALIEWARKHSQRGTEAKLPDILTPHLFEREPVVIY